jgi:hypothetical protein
MDKAQIKSLLWNFKKERKYYLPDNLQTEAKRESSLAWYR